MEDLKITRHGDANAGEYRAHVPGSAPVGRLTWVQRGDVRAAEHTLVPPEIGGRGVAAGLVDALIADARAQGFKVRPDCSFIAAAFEKHTDWSDLKA